MTMSVSEDGGEQQTNNNNNNNNNSEGGVGLGKDGHPPPPLGPPSTLSALPPLPPPPGLPTSAVVAPPDRLGAAVESWKWEQQQSPLSNSVLPPLGTPHQITPVMAAQPVGGTHPPVPPQSSHHIHHLNQPPSYTELGVKAECNECSFCGDIISDRYIFQVASRSWHSHCLRCCVCQATLDTHASCFFREEQLYCKHDYVKLFGAKCYKCCRMISPTDWVRKAREQIYHLACFACDSCKRQLSTGEEFGIHENRVLCKAHYMEILDGGCTSSDESNESENHSKKKTKRMRTTFTEEQIQILQANFQIDSNPDGQDLERIAQITGLSKRVTQVWFQNCRARQKKYMNTGKARSGNGGKSKSVPLSSGVSPVARDQCSTPQQLDLHVMYSTFRAQQPAPSADSNPDDISTSDSNPPGFMRGEV